MKTTLLAISVFGIILTGCTNKDIKPVEPVENNTSTVSKIDATKILDEFLRENDAATIKKEKKEALAQGSKNKKITAGLPPRTPDLFASGLFMSYEDKSGIYHDYDHIYFKVKDGNWELAKSNSSTKKRGFVFTKESGVN